MGNEHVLLIPYPVQGHVIPLMELAQCLVRIGFKITFVNTEITHKRVVDALRGRNDILDDQIHLVSIPDGLESGQQRNIPGKLSEATFWYMPGKLEDVILEINASGDCKITCVIADQSLGWALEVAAKLGILRAAFLPAAAAMLVLGFSIPKLIVDGIITSDGTPLKNQRLQLSPTMPYMDTENFVWSRVGNTTMQKVIFKVMVKNNKALKLADWLICNSNNDLEPGAFTLAPEIVPIGPLLASNRFGNSGGYFWQEDSTCLEWLDEQPACSVVYVAFGSFTVFDQMQFQELATGLEITSRPFLWVVRPDITDGSNDAYPEGFLDRIATRGQIVGWAPQQKVLSHPSIACFLSHCGWNSTIEGLSNGLPFLCWPYFADQFTNESYICDIWRVGLRFERDENGIITREDVKNKVDQLLGDNRYKERALNFKEIMLTSVREGGSSYKNFVNFINWMRV